MDKQGKISEKVCQLLIAKDSAGLKRMLESGEIEPDRWIESTLEGERFRLLPAVIERNWTELALYLLSKGADANARSMTSTPLMIACGMRNHEIIDVLLVAGADVNARAPKHEEGGGETALMISAEKRDPWAIKRLLGAGADPKILTRRNYTAVYFATVPRTSEETAKVIRELVAAGCPLLGFELHWPIHRREVETTKLLLESGCPPNVPFVRGEKNGPQRGETPLTIAVDTNAIDLAALGSKQPSTKGARVEIIRALCASGADPNLPSIKGWTPLMLAVWSRELDLAELLLGAGAAPEYVPPRSKVGSPLELAAKRKVESFSELVQRTRKQPGA